LLEALGEVENLEDDFWKEVKTKEISDILRSSLGLYLEAKAKDYSYVPGDTIDISYEMINRSPLKVTIDNVYLNEIRASDRKISQRLDRNNPYKSDQVIVLPKGFSYSNPYWLNEKGSLGMYTVSDQLQRGKPENDPALTVSYEVAIEGVPVTFTSPVIYKRNDPVDGEVYRPLEITPSVFTNIDTDVLLFSNNNSKSVEVTVTAGKEALEGRLTLDLPDSWQVTPSGYDFKLDEKGEEAKFNFLITPPKKQDKARLYAVATIKGQPYRNGLSRIIYDHIPVQGIYTPQPASLVRVNLEKKGEKIGYIMGAGDDIPGNLEQIGYQVDILDKNDVTSGNLAGYDAVILGIRALNTVSWLQFKMDDLLEYTKNGGNLIIQYNTSFRLVTRNFAPYPLKLSRDRVTVEEAEVSILAGDHPVMNYPNKITKADFEGWVQERGLYFPNEWSDEYTAIISANDPGEPERKGGILVAKYGKGHYIYTGISFFRELPAGVPGAYRIFTNMISLGNDK
ncbi:MAG: LmbE family protein, partial [Cyclobacteriaceae bacterium]